MKVLKKKYRFLSPAVGCALANNPFLFNLYSYGTERSATVQLVRELFFKAGSSEHLNTTHNKSKPGFFLNPQRLGLLVGLIERNKLTDGEKLSELIEPLYRESRCSRRSLSKFVQLIAESALECSPGTSPVSLFFPHTTTHILLAFLWKSATTREELLTYMLAVDKELGARSSIFKNAKLASEKKRKKWLRKSGRRFDVCEDGFLGDNLTGGRLYEAMTAKALLLRNRLLPPQLTYQGYSYEGMTPRPDCVESSVRNVINILLYNIEAQQFDISRLEALCPYPPLLEFYRGEGRFAAIGPQSAEHGSVLSACSGQAWMELLSSLAGVQYMSGVDDYRYEILPDLKNVLTVFNILFKVRATSLPELGRLISRKGCAVSFKVMKESEVNSLTRGEVAITFDIKGIKLEGITLTIEEGHAWMKYPVSGCSLGDESALVGAWTHWVKEGKHSHVLPLLALLMEPWKCLDMQLLENATFSETRQLYHLMMSLTATDAMVGRFESGPLQHWLIKDFVANYKHSKTVTYY